MGESLQAKRTRKDHALNRLLSATALGLFLEGCGGGFDVPPYTLSYARKTDSGVTVDLSQGLYPPGFEAGAGVGVSRFSVVVTGNVINLIGSPYADSLTGDGQSNRFTGGKGDDFLAAGGGEDEYVFGLGDGNDVVADDDAETDSFIFTHGNSPNDLDFRLEGDTLVVSIRDVVVRFDVSPAGESFFIPLRIYYGDADNPVFIGEVWSGSDGVDSFQDFSAARNIIFGWGENDVLQGGGGNDVLFGGVGDDALFGDEGDDDLYGGVGSDDYWIFFGDNGTDQIEDSTFLQAGEENRVILQGGDPTDFRAERDNNNLNIVLSPEQNVIIVDFYAIFEFGGVPTPVQDIFSINSHALLTGVISDITATLLSTVS